MMAAYTSFPTPPAQTPRQSFKVAQKGLGPNLFRWTAFFSELQG